MDFDMEDMEKAFARACESIHYRLYKLVVVRMKIGKYNAFYIHKSKYELPFGQHFLTIEELMAYKLKYGKEFILDDGEKLSKESVKAMKQCFLLGNFDRSALYTEEELEAFSL